MELLDSLKARRPSARAETVRKIMRRASSKTIESPTEPQISEAYHDVNCCG
jgi:hypothetical protein